MPLSVGSAVVIIFGTQRDVLRTWMFWKSNDDNHSRLERSGTPSPVKLYWSDDNSEAESSRTVGFCVGQRKKERTNLRGMPISQPVLREDLNLASSIALAV